jgi:hypothetical protein
MLTALSVIAEPTMLAMATPGSAEFAGVVGSDTSVGGVVVLIRRIIARTAAQRKRRRGGAPSACWRGADDWQRGLPFPAAGAKCRDRDGLAGRHLWRNLGQLAQATRDQAQRLYAGRVIPPARPLLIAGQRLEVIGECEHALIVHPSSL